MSGTTIIFFSHGGKECVRNKPSYRVAHLHFSALLQTPYFYYSKVHVKGFLQHFELERPSNCKISHWVSRGRVFERLWSICRSQRSSPWNSLFVWVTTGFKFSWRHLCATLLQAKHDVTNTKGMKSNGSLWKPLEAQQKSLLCATNAPECTSTHSQTFPGPAPYMCLLVEGWLCHFAIFFA